MKELDICLTWGGQRIIVNIYSYICRYDGNYSFTNGSKDSKLGSFSIFLFHHTSGHQKIIKEIKGDITNKTTQGQDYLLLISTITFPDYIKN